MAWWIRSTISGFASVVVSPTSAKLETAAITPRMILRERLFGTSSHDLGLFGRAIGRMSFTIVSNTFVAVSRLDSIPG